MDVGFNPQNLLLFRINPQLNRYDEKRQTALYTQLLDRIAAVPGVRGAAMSNPALLSGSVNSTSIFVQGRVYEPGLRDYDNINRLVISPNFFETMEIPILLGRGFTAQRQRYGAEGRRHQRGGGEEVLPEREPDRPALRLEHRDHRTSSRSSACSRTPSTTACAMPAPPTMYVPFLQARAGQRRDRGADRRRSGERHRRRCARRCAQIDSTLCR